MELLYKTNSFVDTLNKVLNGYQLKLELLGAGYGPKLIYSKEMSELWAHSAAALEPSQRRAERRWFKSGSCLLLFTNLTLTNFFKQPNLGKNTSYKSRVCA